MLRITFNKKVGTVVTGLGTVIKISSNVSATASLVDLLHIREDCATSAAEADISETNALASASSASSSATNAASSAAAALASKNAASTSAANVANSASAALASKNAAATSETNAASSALAASSSATNADTSAAAALASKNAAATSETNAANSAASALASKNAAATSETNAASSAASALASKDAASISETNAANSAVDALASKDAAATSKTNADTSAAAALASKNAAATSETNAANSAASALASKNAAATSETNAASSAASALASKDAASISETNAANSAVDALASKNAAATSETNAASSAASALASKDAAATSETNAASSASSALASKDAAATSETNAASSASSALASKNAAATSETNAASSAASALASKDAASTSETNAASSAASALASKDAAAISETNAANSAVDALASKDAAATSETNAASSASSALASKNAAATSKTNADTSAAAALASKNAAATSETNAANSAASALASKNAAATSETNAASSAASALASKDAASISETNAANSAVDALASKDAAATSETNAASSASSALASKDAAATSETNAASSASSALASKNAAATSETNAASSAASALASKDAASTSETNAASSAASALASKDAAAISETNAATAASASLASAAMLQAQFDSIRAQNNEEFAASGFVHFGRHFVRSGYLTEIVNQGLFTAEAAAFSNVIALGNSSTYKVGSSKTDEPTINIAGVIFKLSDGYATGYGNSWAIKFPQAPDGNTTYNKTTGVITNHVTVTDAFNAQTADPTNVEVVTDRVDMWGFEAWLEEVSTTNPYVYPNGLIQSQATTMDGIDTSASARPVTYYAVFDGDTGSRGTGLNYFDLSDANKRKVLANHKNNLYYLADGRLVQWRLRQRTFAGAGNGDWGGISSKGLISLGFASNKPATVQGALEVALGGSARFREEMSSSNPSPQIGLFTAQAANGTGINGECYFLVCGTVNRLNQGAYHPSFNPSGARFGPQGNRWNTVAAVASLISTIDCFTQSYAGLGSISSAFSGRPDNRYFDIIYAAGQGGVCRDMRYSAYGVDSVDFAEADQRVKNGTYRGFEAGNFTKILPRRLIQTVSEADIAVILSDMYRFKLFNTPSEGQVVAGGTLYINGKPYIIVSVDAMNASQGRLLSPIDVTGMTSIGFDGGWTSYTAPIPTIFTSPIYPSIGGSFLQTDIIGNPANILAIPALANGWQGSWVPVVPDGIRTIFPLTRKCLLNTVKRTYTSNKGASFVSTTVNIDTIKNEPLIVMGPNVVALYQYPAFAKQVESAVNGVVYGGKSGVGEVFSSSYYDLKEGTFLGESLCGIVNKNSLNTTVVNNKILNSVALTGDAVLTSSPNFDGITHPALTLGDPNNNSPAFKALNYIVNLNQQVFIQYAYTELKHNGNNWGDDGKVTIVDNQSTKTDLNGNTVLVGTAKLKEPIGWIKNKV